MLRNLIKNKPDKEGYITLKNKNGTTIKVHQKADESEIEDNIKTGFVLAKVFPNLDIRIREHKEQIKGSCKNPEYLINGRLGDAKRLEDISGITNGAKSAKEQGCKVIIYDYNKKYKPKYINYKKTAQRITHRKADFEDGTLEDIYLIRGEKVLHIPANKGTDLKWIITRMQNLEL